MTVMNCRVCGNNLPQGALFCGECGSAFTASSEPEISPESTPQQDNLFIPESQNPETLSTNIVGTFNEGIPEISNAAPVEYVAPRFADEEEFNSVVSFTVTLETGESVEVTESALVGRMPQPLEGEQFEHLIVIPDPGRSVSKTHLELGVDQGSLWVKDRGSGNGSIIREPGVVPRRAQPGTRYDIVRGTRIDMGNLHLIVS